MELAARCHSTLWGPGHYSPPSLQWRRRNTAHVAEAAAVAADGGLTAERIMRPCMMAAELW